MGGITVKASHAKTSVPAEGSKPPSVPRRKTSWWAYVAGALCLTAAWPIYQYYASSWQMQNALAALAAGDPNTAISKLEIEEKSHPGSAELVYWLAVAHRRAGHIQVFQGHLQRAKELGYPEDEIQRQVLLMRLQSGVVSEDLEKQAADLIQRADKYPGARMDLFVDEFYEARARGFLANYRLFDAHFALDHWVQDRPESIPARLMRADIRERELDFQGAEKEYQEILALAPDNVPARLQRARLLMLNVKVKEAAEEFRICLEISPQDVRAQIGLAECEFRTGQGMTASRQRLEKLLEQELTDKDRASALYLLGEIARSQKENELVVKYLLEATQLAPAFDAGPYRTLSTAYASLGQLKEAQKYLEISKQKGDRTARLVTLMGKIMQSPQNADLRFEQGSIYWEEGMKDEAAGWWNMAVRFKPQHQAAHEALAEYYAEKGDSERVKYHRYLAEQSAITTFDNLWAELLDSNTKAVREGLPKLARYPALREVVELLTLGLNVVERKDLEIAAQGLGRLTNNPKLRMRSLTMLGEALHVMGHINAAERAYQEVLATSPRNVVAHRGLQSLYFDLGAYDPMEHHALQVAAIDKTDYRPHRHLGFLRREAETWDAAIRDYKESLLRSPHQPTRQQVLLEMADCYVHMMKYDEAQKALQDAVPSAQKSYLEAQCKYATKKVAEAKEQLDESLRTSPDHAPSLLLRSDIALIDRDAIAAREYLERAVKAAPFDNNAHQKLSIVLLRLDEKEAAQKEADRAKELLDLHLRFSELNLQASQRPKDIAVRKEMASLARQLGREEEAQRWDRVVEGLAADPVPALTDSTLPRQEPESEKLTLTPDVRERAPKAGPQPKPKPAVKQPEAAVGPKACGDESAAAAEQPREEKGRDERPAEKKEEKKEEIFSGPQKGEKLPGFTLKITGEEEKELDIVKDAEGKPTLIVFVHTVTRPSVGMARILGDYAATRKKDGLHAGVVFLTGDATETKAWIKRAVGALPKNVPLGIAEGGQEGPGAYGLNRNVAMTILVAKEGKVTANFPLVQPSLQADGPKILKEIVDALGGGKVPSIEELSKPPEPRRERPNAPEKREGEKERKREGEKGR